MMNNLIDFNRKRNNETIERNRLKLYKKKYLMLVAKNTELNQPKKTIIEPSYNYDDNSSINSNFFLDDLDNDNFNNTYHNNSDNKSSNEITKLKNELLNKYTNDINESKELTKKNMNEISELKKDLVNKFKNEINDSKIELAKKLTCELNEIKIDLTNKFYNKTFSNDIYEVKSMSLENEHKIKISPKDIPIIKEIQNAKKKINNK